MQRILSRIFGTSNDRAIKRLLPLVDRINGLESEISKLDKKISEIRDLELEKERLLARMQIIQQLQSSRPEIVHLMDELPRTSTGKLLRARLVFEEPGEADER